MRQPLRLLSIVLVGLVPVTVEAQTSYPMISRVEPTAIQRGQTATLTLSGTGDFSGASGLLVEGSGLAAEIGGEAEVAKPQAKTKGAMQRLATGSSKVKLAVDEKADPGVREVRLVTPQGVSSVGLVMITDDPVVLEGDDKANNAAKGATKLTLPTVVSGKIGAVEDVDWYAFDVKAGQKVAFSLWGNRLENKIHDLQTHLDPILILHDASGRELAADDNHDFADPLLIHTFTQAGTYFLEIRDTNYAGNANWTYVLMARTAPYVTSVFPMAVYPGKKAELQGQGVNFDPGRALTLDLPGSTPIGPKAFPLNSDGGRTQPVPVVVTSLPVVTERDDTSETIDKSQSVPLPAAISGRLAEKNDVDTYRFDAKKGQIYAFEVVARRAGSAADPILRVLDSKGAVLTELDDTPGQGKDPRIEWTAPSDGVFAIQVGDLHARGGPEFGYVILAEPARPDFVATCDPDKINIGPGCRTTVFVKVVRRAGFAGPVAFAFDKLPEGVTASALTVAPTMTQGVIVVTAPETAKPGGALATLRAKGDVKEESLARTVSPIQEIYLPGGGRGLYAVGTMAVGVTRPSDIKIEAKPTEIVISPGESAVIDVTVTRQGGYDKGVNLAVNLAHLGQTFASSLPPGVTAPDKGAKTLLGPKETAGKIVIQAAADAPACEKVPIAVMGHVSINFVVKTAYSSAPIAVTVRPKAAKK